MFFQTLSLVKVKEALQSAGISAATKVKKGKGEVERLKKNIGCVLGIGGGQKVGQRKYMYFWLCENSNN